jgi:hypothetical protein
MKRLVSMLCVVTLGAALVPAVSMAGAPFQLLVGAGWRGNVENPNTPITHFVVIAWNAPGFASGTYISMNPNNPLFNYTADVTCLDVVGNHAIVGGVVRRGGAPGQLGTGFAVGFIDNGRPPDAMTFSDLEIPTPVDCAGEESLFIGMLFPVLQGNVVVGDLP